MARKQKTERQRAEEALAVAQRKVDRLVKAEQHQASLLDMTRAELADERRILAYRAQHPALPQKSDPTTQKETTTP